MNKYVVIAACLMLVSAAHATEGNVHPTTSVAAPELDSAINDVITQPEYAWRLAREKRAAAETGLWSAFFGNIVEWSKRMLRPLVAPLKRAGRWIARMLKSFSEWLEGLGGRSQSQGQSSLNWQTGVRALLFVVLAGALSFLIILLLRMWRNRRRPVATASAVVRPTVSDILEERVTADELPVDEWMAMAREFLGNGDFRLAVRAMFLACLVYLANREKLTIAKHKSNREYIGELDRRAHDAPDVLAAFSANVGILERLWYGMHKATADTVTAFTDNQETILGAEMSGRTPPRIGTGHAF